MALPYEPISGPGRISPAPHKSWTKRAGVSRAEREKAKGLQEEMCVCLLCDLATPRTLADLHAFDQACRIFFLLLVRGQHCSQR